MNMAISKTSVFRDFPMNENSKWFCIDVEWAKAFKNKQEKDNVKRYFDTK
jgi:hypothetical protein